MKVWICLFKCLSSQTFLYQLCAELVEGLNLYPHQSLSNYLVHTFLQNTEKIADSILDTICPWAGLKYQVLLTLAAEVSKHEAPAKMATFHWSQDKDL